MITGYFGAAVSLDIPQNVTVLVTYFNPVRMKNVNHQIRNVLKCNFVERVIISNHNPDVHIEDYIEVSDPRLVILNQPVRRGCGFRWRVADAFDFDYLVVIDDDFLLFPGQLRSLVRFLLKEPAIPHGVSGMNSLQDGGFEFRDREEIKVDFLCEVYALTSHQLQRYREINAEISSDEQVAKIVDAKADFMLISQTGIAKPKIHNVGRLFRDQTFKLEGVAVHKDGSFDESVEQVLQALKNRGLIQRH